jgi:hypothetical protein
MLTKTYVDQVLSPWVSPFKIDYDGTSQTHPNNHGRVGFFAESKFHVAANSDRGPDLGHTEIKTVRSDFGNYKNMSIGLVTKDEYRNLRNSSQRLKFENSEPYKKMHQTLFITYCVVSPGTNPVYSILSWKNVNLNELPHNIRMRLQADYDQCVHAMKSYSFDELSDKVRIPRGATKYLTIVPKGDTQYVYPSWKFKANFLKDIL